MKTLTMSISLILAAAAIAAAITVAPVDVQAADNHVETNQAVAMPDPATITGGWAADDIALFTGKPNVVKDPEAVVLGPMKPTGFFEKTWAYIVGNDYVGAGGLVKGTR